MQFPFPHVNWSAEQAPNEVDHSSPPFKYDPIFLSYKIDNVLKFIQKQFLIFFLSNKVFV